MGINSLNPVQLHQMLKNSILITFVVLTFFPSSILALSSYSLRVSDNKIIQIDGSQFIPYGISIYGGLEDVDFTDNLPNIDAQIKAAVTYWHANTIRLQVSEDNLFSNINKKLGYNTKFMKELQREVNLARSLNQIVVINDQTEFTSNFPLPTVKTVKFWKQISSVFGNNPYIIYDLFNEPRLDSLKLSNISKRHSVMLGNLSVNKANYSNFVKRNNHPKQSVWSIWKYGGIYNGINYIGEQALVDDIRSWKVNNIIWVEGPFWAQTLPSKNNLLKGANIVYSFHHINLNNPKSWNFISRLAQIRPVVDGEWAQYQSPWQECFVQAPTQTPNYLKFLNIYHIGLIAWSLQPGSLVKGSTSIVPKNNNTESDTSNPANLSIPSSFSNDYECNNQFGQGAGQLIQQYFKVNSKQL